MSNSNYPRVLTIDLPKKQSCFLWGARKTGKSTYLRTRFKESLYYDLLKSDLYIPLSKEPHIFREEILALSEEKLKHPIIVDEVQKIPLLMDEIHWLIEHSNAQFILCGSSARKMKQSGVNLLGGRAWSYHFYPLVYPELPHFDLLQILNHGTIPAHFDSTHIHKSLNAYIHDYLTEEIKAESLVRNLPAFARFLDSLGFTSGQMVNYQNIARDCGVDAKTVKEYFTIITDTLLGYMLLPYNKRVKRDIIISAPKFYLFDVGLATKLSTQPITTLKGEAAGRAVEHYIVHELTAYLHMHHIETKLSYWRTKAGIEVDCVIGDADYAIEIKISDRIRPDDLKGLIAFAKEYGTQELYLVCNIPRPRKLNEHGITITALPFKDFLEKLWHGHIIR